MKQKKLHFLSLAMVVTMLLTMFSTGAFAADTAAGANLVSNPGFENGITGWSVSGGDGACYVTDLFSSQGERCLILKGNSAAAANAVSQNITVSKSGVYKISINAMLTKSGSSTVLYAQVKQADGTVISSKSGKTFTSGSGWQTDTVSIEVPDGNMIVSIKLGVSSYVHDIAVDNIGLARTGDIQPPTGNLLTNSSFENDMTGWVSQGNPYAYATTAQKHSGTKSLAMGYFTSEGLANYVEQSYTVKVKGKVTFAAYVKTDTNLTGAGAALFIDALDSQGNVVKTAASSAVSNTNGAWQQLAVTMDMPEGTKQLVVKIAGLYCTGVFYADDAALSYVI